MLDILAIKTLISFGFVVLGLNNFQTTIMKKLWLLVATIAIVSCKEEAKIDYAIISGKIMNAESNEATVYGPNRFNKKITLAEDGTFNDTIKKVQTGTFTLYQARNATPLYLKSGDNVAINYDAKDFKSTLAVSGAGSEISSYLIAKGDKQRELMGQGTEVYVKEEADYKKVMSDIKSAHEALLDAAAGIPDDYKAKEKRNLNYAYLGQLNQYESYHSYFAKKQGFKASEGFLSELENVSYDNEEDFKFSDIYKSLVTAHYRKKASELAKKDSIDNSIASFKIYGSIANETIKNHLAYSLAEYNITYTDQLEDFYAAYMATSTNKENNDKVTENYNKLKVLAKGNPSPKFVNYENYAGGTTSLDDLKGKYIYIDVWATWCGPCKAEIPFLKKVEKQYHGKNIEFVSISIDKAKDHEAWKTMIKEKELGGVQLFADNDWKSAFVEGYLIKGIPKFILLDPAGNIVTANAPRPSNAKLVELFDDLKI